MRGLVIEVDGVPFQPVKWEFTEDGYLGAIYFRVPEGAFEEGANNGASHWAEPDVLEPNVRMACPCTTGLDEEAAPTRPLQEALVAAAQDACANLTRKP